MMAPTSQAQALASRLHRVPDLSAQTARPASA
jgi:hypothetical protein